MPRRTDDVLAGLDAELFAPGLLHELKQPLMGADAAATLLERSLGRALDAVEEWRMLRGQLARIAEIVSGYEELLRPEASPPAPFAVGPVVGRSVELLAHRVRPLGQRFTLGLGPGRLEGFGRPAALVHAATNLLANALDAIEDAPGARLEVRVLEHGPHAVEVRVSDEGVGVSSDARARMFEARFTTKAPGKGTGLGLHIARRLMAQDGGQVYLVPEEDPARLPWAVTEFCVRVPAPGAGGAR
ncbi:sensor histidine kinase [Anaeromyxobacter terrae]|uniref:sensor histidine kinase n=1 Tax=Anaeromyxobacter terrae TaxID=2925406 RepID=UPI001F56645A|nr:HAMP domain-containing sensor histidine kinase [Anaeromyxobacter sp. SG22]